MFYQIFLSPQVKRRGDYYLNKRWAIITGLYKLPQELPNDLTLKKLGNKEILGKCISLIGRKPSAQSPRQNESPANTSAKPLEDRH